MIRFKRPNCEFFAQSKFFRLLPVLALAAGLGGCSFSMALPSFLHDDETGSIVPQRTRLGERIDDDDWRIARPALEKALGATDSDPPVAWSNPATGRSGLFQSVGLPFAREGARCRAFVAGISDKDQKAMLQGVGCVATPGEIDVADVKPWKGL